MARLGGHAAVGGLRPEAELPGHQAFAVDRRGDLQVADVADRLIREDSAWAG